MTTSEARDPEKSVVEEEVVLGDDTHLDVLVAVVLDRRGRDASENLPCRRRGRAL